MSNLYHLFPKDHRVFGGGRYLKHLSKIPDIDVYEHAILLYLGSLMPFDRGFIGEIAFPSHETIRRATKIGSKKTVIAKIGSLVEKGYLVKKSVWTRGKFGGVSQSSNDYMITTKGFLPGEDYLVQEDIAEEKKKKRANGRGYDCQSPTNTTPDSKQTLPKANKTPTQTLELDTNSLEQLPPEDPNLDPNSLFPELPNISHIKRDIDETINTWEKLMKRRVSEGERRSFEKVFIHLRASSIGLQQDIFDIQADPYLMCRAKSINFLFQGLSAAKKNKSDITKVGRRRIQEAYSAESLKEVEASLPELITAKSGGFMEPDPNIVELLFGKDLSAARNKLGISFGDPKPEITNTTQLLSAIQQELTDPSISTKRKSRLNTIRGMASTCGFALLMKSYIAGMGV